MSSAQLAASALGAHARPRHWLFPGFLSVAECDAELAEAAQRGFVTASTDFPPSYRTNRRQVVDDAAKAARLFARFRAIAPPELTEQDCDGRRWRLLGVNPRLRTCQYQPGEAFFLHQDGVRFAADGSRSLLTFMVYLDDPATFDGGETRFFRGGPGTEPNEVLLRLRPERGTLIVFDHALWHDGAEVVRGRKHVLRSDLMFAAEPLPRAENAAPFTPGHAGYVWRLLKLRDGRLCSAGRDAVVRLWTSAGHADGALHGHTQSIVSLAEPGPGVLATLSRDRQLVWWDLSTKRELARATAHEGTGLTLLSIGPWLFSGGADGKLRRWERPGAAGPSCLAHDGWLWDLACFVSDDGRQRLASVGEDGWLRTWDAASLEQLHAVRHDHPLRAVAVHAGRIVCGDLTGAVHVWRAAELQPEGTVRRHRAAVRRLSWSPDGRLISTGEDGAVSLSTGALGAASVITEHTNFATDAVVLDDRHILSSGYDGALRLSKIL